jgi:hypothetical protein
MDSQEAWYIALFVGYQICDTVMPSLSIDENCTGLAQIVGQL